MNQVNTELNREQELYQSKLMSAEEAIETFLPDAQFVTFGCYAGTPVSVSKAYAEAAKKGLFTHPIETYLFRSSAQVVSFFNHPDVLETIHLQLPFMGGEIGTLLKTARNHLGKVQYPEYIPGHFSHMESGFLTQEGDPDVHMLQVSPMDDHGYFSFGLDGSFSIPAARRAKRIIVEVNENMPRTFGDGIISVHDVDAIVEHTSDLLVLPNKPAKETDHAIAEHIINYIPDGACIQLGIVGVPDAVGKFLLNKNDLGVDLLERQEIFLNQSVSGSENAKEASLW